MSQNLSIQQDSAAWLVFVKLSFIISLAAMGIGIYFIPAALWVKGYLAMGLLFVTGSTLTLSKTLRDEHEAKKIINQIQDVKTERILRDYEGESA